MPRVHPADLSVEAEAVAAVARAAALGELTIGVNAAGTASVGDSRDFDAARWDAEFAINVRGTFVVCREIGTRLLAREAPGSIVNFSSTASAAGIPMATAHSATKFAVDGLTKSLAAEWAQAGVRVNAVAPAFVETPLNAAYLSDPANRAGALARIPIGRFLAVAEIASTVTL